MILDELRWIPCQNIGGETIPPHSVVRMSSAKVDKQGSAWLKVEQSDQPGFDARTYVTGELAIEPDGYGRCTRESPVVVACTGTPKPGEIWGPVPNAFELSSGYPGATIHDVMQTDREAVLALIYRDLQCLITGVLQETLAAPTDGWTDPTTANVTIYRIGTQATAGGDLADYVATTDMLTLVNRDTSLEGAAGNHVVATRIDNEWRALWVGC